MSNTTELLQVTPDLRILNGVPLRLEAVPLGPRHGHGVVARIQQAIGFAMQAMPEDR